MFQAEDPDREAQEKLAEFLDWMEDWVEDTGFIAGTKNVTLADIAFLAIFATLEQFDHVVMDIHR